MNELLIGRILVGVTAFGYFAYKLWGFWQERKATKNTPIIEGTMMFSDELLAAAYEYSTATQTATIEKFDLGNYDRWFIDQETATLSFYKDDVPMVKANIQILGSQSVNDKSWMWSLLNDSILDECVDDLEPFWHIVESGCGINNHPEVDEQFIADAVSVSMHTLNAKGYYRAPSANSHTYLILTNVEWVA